MQSSSKFTVYIFDQVPLKYPLQTDISQVEIYFIDIDNKLFQIGKFLN